MKVRDRKSKPSAAHRLLNILPFIITIAVLITGIVIGISLDLVGRITGSLQTVISTTVLAVLIALALLLVLFGLQRRATAKLKDAAGNILDSAKSVASSFLAPRQKGFYHAQKLTQHQAIEDMLSILPAAISYWVTGRTYWRLFLAVGSIIGAAVLVSQFLVLTEQTQRLTEQNQLIQLEARLAAIARQADLEQLSAARAYDEITRILDQNASSGAIVDALDRLPEAMVMSVSIVDPGWSPTPDATTPVTKTVYPNLVPLAQRLLTFAKSDRPAEDLRWSDEEIGAVSTGIAQALHRLGFGNAEDSCVWHCIFDGVGSPWDNTVARLDDLRGTSSDAKVLAERASGLFKRPDMRHLRDGQLWAVQLQGADLSGASFQGTEMYDAKLQGADLRGAQLQGAHLSGAQLQEAHLGGAQLQGAEMVDAQLQGAYLGGAQLQGAEMVDAQLQGAYLGGAQLQGAEMVDAQLQGAYLGGAQLQGAYLRGAQLQGADLSGASLQGADLSGARLAGADVEFNIDPLTGIPSIRRIALDLPTVTLHLPPAILSGITMGHAITMGDQTLVNSFPTMLLGIKRNSGDLLDLWEWWPTRETAEADLRQRLGEAADDAIAKLVTRPTQLIDASLDGILIDQETLDAIPADATSPPPAEAFENADTNLAAVKARKENPHRFPTWAELLKLAEQQASERAKNQVPNP